jgi:hypothetical protein
LPSTCRFASVWLWFCLSLQCISELIRSLICTFEFSCASVLAMHLPVYFQYVSAYLLRFGFVSLRVYLLVVKRLLVRITGFVSDHLILICPHNQQLVCWWYISTSILTPTHEWCW